MADYLSIWTGAEIDSAVSSSVKTTGDFSMTGKLEVKGDFISPKLKTDSLISTDGTKTVLVKDLVDVAPIGVGQTWQDVKSARVAGTTYTNGTAEPIMISVTSRAEFSESTANLTVHIDGIIVSSTKATGRPTITYGEATASLIVSSGSTYKVEIDIVEDHTPAITHWAELRETP